MTFATWFPLAVLGLVGLVAAWWLVTHFYSDEARWERRRRRSNAPIINKRKRHTVKFSVRLGKNRKR